MDQVEEIKRKTDIVSVISEYTELKKAGRNYKGLCPFHLEKTSSFMVSPELQIYKCFGCQVGGDVYKFLMDLERIEFPQALKVLADRAGITLVQKQGFTNYAEKDEIYSLNFLAAEFYHYLLLKHESGGIARDYLAKRGINEEAIAKFKLGFSPPTPDAVFQFLTKKRGHKPELLEKAGIVVRGQGGYYDRFRGRIIFPLKDHFGNYVGFAGRVIEGRGDVAKYINSPETLVYKKGKTLYGLETAKQAIKEKGFAVIVEGEIDCISCWQVGIENVVAIKGSAFTEDQAQLLSRFTDRVVLVLDTDFAGNEAAKRGLEILQKQAFNVQVASLGEYKDPDEAARENPQALKNAISGASGVYDFLINLVFERVDISTTEGKSQASRQLGPILASIEDEIVRASCIKTVAQKIGVPEQAVIAQIRKQPTPNQTFVPMIDSNKPQAKTRRELLEEQLIAYIFHNNPQDLFEKENKYFIQSSPRIRLIEEMEKVYKENPQADLQTLSQSLPSELQDFLSIIVLSQVELEDQEAISREITQIKSELNILDTKQKISLISDKIKILEDKGDTKGVVNLEQELANLGQELSLLEAQVL